MIELIILIAPGMLGCILHSKLNNYTNWKKIIICFITYTLCINFFIYGGLWLIGMKNFSLFDMGTGFKIKWLMLGLALAVMFVLTFVNIRNIDRNIFFNIIKRLLPASMLLTVTYAIYTPSSLFLENISEFLFNYISIVPIILASALILWFAANVAALCLTNEKTLIYYIALIFAVSMGAYLQRSFLNPQFPTLDGTQIDWSSYAAENKISALVWLACILIIFIFVSFFKGKAEKTIKYISLFLSSVQLISLIVLLVTIRLPEEADHGYSKDAQFSVGSKENIIIFIIDTLQASALEDYIRSDVYPEGELDDFTFFDNMVSGGASTQIAMPVLLTGCEYDPMQPIEEYNEEVWLNAPPFYNFLHENDYDIRFFSDNKSIIGSTDGIADNYTITVKNHIGSYAAFGSRLYKLVCFYLSPQFAKQFFWTSTDDITQAVISDNSSYRKDNFQFYEDFKAAGGLTADYDKTFRLYHLYGVHMPYNLDENIEKIDEEQGTEQKQLRGVLKEITLYINELKRLKIYDKSAIVITGDHGRHEDDNPESNPAFLIKMPGESHKLEHNSSPVHFRNLHATLASTITDDYSFYGPSIYDITSSSDVERLHTINRGIRNRNYVDDEWDDSYSCCRLIVPDEILNLDKYVAWDPFNINRIQYTLGDDIDFTDSKNKYISQLNYRLYKENGAATASNELSICFDLQDYKKGSLSLHFTYDKIYNDEQNIRIYANGAHVGNITCAGENSGIDNILTIPSKHIKDNELVIRMVFPNAVTPNQLDRSNDDTRILSVEFTSMRLE